jgi:hypothetical protein
MKQIIKNYTFNAAAKTVTCSDFSSVALDRLLLVTNVSANKIIYQFNSPGLGAAASGNTFTLSYDTSAMQNSDKLQIVYDCATGDPLYDSVTAGTTAVQGSSAAGSADSGNPVKIGAVYHASPPAFADGQRGDLQIDGQGRLMVNTAPLAASTDSIATQGNYNEFTSLTAGALNADLVQSTDVSAYRAFSLQVTGTWVGTLSIQFSDDNGTWINAGTAVKDSTQTFLTAGTLTSNAMVSGPILHRYLRVRMTAYTSGTANGVLELFTVAANTHMQLVASSATTGASVPTTAFYMGVTDGSGNLRGLGNAAQGDIASGATILGISQYLLDTAQTNIYQRKRNVGVFKTTTATSSVGTNLWQPAAGKKFRLMRYMIQATGDVAISGGGVVDVVLKDSTTGLAAAFSFYAPATAGTTAGGGATSGWVDLGNGILSTTADNILVVGLSATLTSGKVRVIACGTEE